MNCPKKIGLIGSGYRLRYVVKNVLEAAEGKIGVGALCDPDGEAVQASQEAFGGDVPVCKSAQELVDRGDIDWVFVGSYNSQHSEHAILALRAGKDVFCEKPLATNLEDCL